MNILPVNQVIFHLLALLADAARAICSRNQT